MNLKQLIDVSVPVLTILLMVAVGLDLTSRDFARVRSQPALVLAGLFGPLLLLPPIALAVTWLLGPPPEVAAALLLIAACPIGGISNTFSYLARASTALSVTLTGLSCLLAALTIPLISRVFSTMSPDSVALSQPITSMLVELSAMLALPIGLGMYLRHRWADGALGYQPVLQRLSFVGVAVVLLLIILDNPQAFLGGLRSTVPAAAMFVACSAAAGWATATSIGADPRDRFTVAVEFGTRNLGVVMAIAVTMLGRVEFGRVAYTYFLTELPLMLMAVVLFRRRRQGVILPAV
jgi:BASS family bile acid:Na+ symporter